MPQAFQGAAGTGIGSIPRCRRAFWVLLSFLFKPVRTWFDFFVRKAVHNLPMTLISTTDALASFCAGLRGAPYITVDTEFMRERTYWAKLCLIQVAGPDAAACIDPLAEGIDLAPLYALFDDPKIVKVFHAARQDIEIFVQATGRVPLPLFDTQVAGMVCGFGESVSYETIATKLADAKIDKSSRFTDWSLRPLTDKQITYALADVTHLRVVYEKLRQQLLETGRGSWIDDEMEILCDPGTYQLDPNEAWKKIKLRIEKPKLAVLAREIAAWREREARRLNIPRGRIFKDETLMEIAHQAPQTVEALARTRGLSQGQAEGRVGEELLAAVRQALETPPADWPVLEAKKAPMRGNSAMLDLLRVLLKQVSDEHDVAPRLIASADDLDRLASEKEPDVKALKGWRFEIFGRSAMALKRGEVALAVRGRKIVLMDAR